MDKRESSDRVQEDDVALPRNDDNNTSEEEPQVQVQESQAGREQHLQVVPYCPTQQPEVEQSASTTEVELSTSPASPASPETAAAAATGDIVSRPTEEELATLINDLERIVLLSVAMSDSLTHVHNSYLTMPMSEERIDEIPIIQISAEQVEANLQCSICYDDFRLNEAVNSLPCSHIYHKDCIKQWLQIRSTCPICRVELNDHSTAARAMEEVAYIINIINGITAVGFNFFVQVMNDHFNITPEEPPDPQQQDGEPPPE